MTKRKVKNTVSTRVTLVKLVILVIGGLTLFGIEMTSDSNSNTPHFESKCIHFELKWLQTIDGRHLVKVMGVTLTKALTKGAIVYLFIDNTAAQSIAQRGTSSKNDLNHIAGSLWLLAASLKVDLQVRRVPSKLNASDPPSRGKPPPFASAGTRHKGSQCHINLLW